MSEETSEQRIERLSAFLGCFRDIRLPGMVNVSRESLAEAADAIDELRPPPTHAARPMLSTKSETMMMGNLKHDAPEWLRLLRGFPAYYLHAALHWACFALLPYAGDWAYRRERKDARENWGP